MRRSRFTLTIPLALAASLLTTSFAAAALDPTASDLYGWSELGLPRELASGFGTALATGDFNCDGDKDLAIGVPEHDSTTLVDVGQVIVRIGPLTPGAPQGLQRIDPAGGANAFSGFGHSMAAGDLDLDGCDDLVVGEPGYHQGRGRMTVLRGRPTGLSVIGARTPDAGSGRFGHSLAILRRGTLRPVVAVGEPSAARAGVAFVGRVWIYFDLLGAETVSEHHCQDDAARSLCGIALATVVAGTRPTIFAGAPDADLIVAFEISTNDEVTRKTVVLRGGESLTQVGRVFDLVNLISPFITSLVVGQPEATVNGRINAGRLALFELGGVFADLLEFNLDWVRDQRAFGFSAETDDRFGSMVRRFDVDGDARDDLLVGAQGERFGTGPASGGVLVLRATGDRELETVRFLRPADLGISERIGMLFGGVTTGFASLPNPAASGDDALLGVPEAVRDPLFGIEGVVVRVPQETDGLFLDGFESGDSSAWSHAVP